MALSYHLPHTLRCCAVSLSLSLSAHHFQQLLGSCFKKNDTTLLNLPSLYIFLHIASGRPHSFRAVPSVATQFQVLLTPLSGCFSAFARATLRYRSQVIFRVGSCCSRVRAQYSMDATLHIPSPSAFRIRGCHSLWQRFPVHFS